MTMPTTMTFTPTRQSLNKRLAAIACVVSLSVFCALASDAYAKAASTLKVVLAVPPSTLDPHIGATSQESWVSRALFPPIFSLSIDGKLQPVLATHYDYNASQKTLDIHLRDDLNWSDGRAFSADDVVFSVQRRAAMIRDYKAMHRGIFNAVQGFSDAQKGNLPLEQIGVDAVSRTHVRFTLNGNDPYLPYRLADFASSILPQHHYAFSPIDWERAEDFVVVGGFIPEAIDITQRITLKANPNFPMAPENRPETLLFYFASQAQSSMRLAQTIGANIVIRLDGEAETMARKAKIGHLKVQSLNNMEQLQFNQQVPALRDPRVRQAIALAVDIEQIIQRANLQAKPANFLLPIDHKVLPNDFDQPIAKRQAQARDLLKQAGFSDDNPLTLRLGSYEVRNKRQYVRYLINDLAAIGIRIEPALYDQFAQLSKAHQQGLVDLTLIGWGGPLYDPAYYLVPLKADGGLIHYENPTIQAKIDQAQAQGEPALRRSQAMEVLTHFTQHYLSFPLFSLGAVWLVADNTQINDEYYQDLWTVTLDD